MKEYAIFALVIVLVAAGFYETVYSEVAKAITEIGAVLERVPHE